MRHVECLDNSSRSVSRSMGPGAGAVLLLTSTVLSRAKETSTNLVLLFLGTNKDNKRFKKQEGPFTVNQDNKW